MMMSSGTGQIGADGTFTIKNVVPGEYKMGVQTTTEGSTPGTTVPETAVMPIIVDSADITGMSLVTSAGWSASGRVTTEDGTAPKIPQARMTVTARLLDFDTAPNSAAFSSPDGGRPRDDWTFSVPGIVGPARLRATVPEGWALKAILQGERDVTDEVLDQKSGESLTGLEVVVTDRVTTVTGQVVGDKGAPVSDGTVMIFTGDAEKWGEQSRWIRTARPDQQGQYQIKGLPPGEYLAIAMEEVEDGIWNDPEYLTGLRASAQRVVLDQGGTKTLSLTLLKPAAR